MARLVLKCLALTLVFLGLAISYLPLVSAQSNYSEEELRSLGIYFVDNAEACTLEGETQGEPFFPPGIDEASLAQKIDDYIVKTLPASPLRDSGKDFVSFGKQYNVNPAFTLALAQKETSLGTAGNGRAPQFNIFNIRNGANGSFGSFPSKTAAIEAVNKLLSGNLYLGAPSNFTTIEQIMNRYAPPSDNNDTPGYIKFISDVLAKISGTPAEPVDTACTPGPVGSGLVDTTGYAFPVSPQIKSQNSGVAGLSQLPCSKASCHHDGTAAFDIGKKPGGDASAGTPVYALSDGVVDQVHLYQGIAGCFSLQLNSSLDKSWYWYGHLQNPVVKNGDTVKAGQQIAEIGVRKCTGNGSLPHLHIDRGCIVNGKPQKGGRKECRDPSFTPFMNKLFESLPS